ncbi:MAG: hypothetical protein LBK13_10615 [Spirochaetales bacterium]|nr:hypothetical protein [Spirochaetales bacterium]
MALDEKPEKVYMFYCAGADFFHFFSLFAGILPLAGLKISDSIRKYDERYSHDDPVRADKTDA